MGVKEGLSPVSPTRGLTLTVGLSCKGSDQEVPAEGGTGTLQMKHSEELECSGFSGHR